MAAEHQTLVVCEIQTRSASGPPSLPMSRAKRSRFRRLAARWLAAHGLLFEEVRVDVVHLIRCRSGALTIEHQREPG